MQKDKPRRIDQLLVELGLTESREQGQRLLLAGAVSVDGQPVTKPGQKVDPACRITLAAREQFVSRGGMKLQRALEYFSLPVAGRICLDIGAHRRIYRLPYKMARHGDSVGCRAGLLHGGCARMSV